jgi:signal peptidase I
MSQSENNPEAKQKKEKQLSKEIAEWIISIVIAVALALVVHNFVFQIVRVEGPSMEPTLYTDQRMFVTRFTYFFNEPQRGDIVVTHFPGDNLNYVKRVIATGGEKLKIEDGNVYIDGVLLEEPYIKEATFSDYPETLVPEGKYMVLGDNRNNSRDSRVSIVGPITKDIVIGKVQYVIWPLNKIHQVNHYTGSFA